MSRYARIFHPCWRVVEQEKTLSQSLSGIGLGESSLKLEPLRWFDVASEHGQPLHRASESAISFQGDEQEGLGEIPRPFDGIVTPDIVDAVFEIAASVTGRQERCICSFWEGWGSLEELGELGTRIEGMSQQGHFLLSAQIDSLWEYWRSGVREDGTYKYLAPQAVWPKDLSWFFAAPFYLSSSFLSGSDEVVSRLLTDTRVESREVFPGDSF